MNKTKINEARIGVYGKRILNQLKEYAPNRYTELLFSGDIEAWLKEQSELCSEKVWEYTKQLAKAQGVTEELKARDQMAWVGAMNALKAQAEELVIMECFN